jgi:hypothetical protein
LKAGDKAWSAQNATVNMLRVVDGNIYAVFTDGHDYTIDGKFSTSDTHPTLFHSEQEFREYWSMESKQLPTRAEIAMAAMQGLLANPDYLTLKWEKIADDSVNAADALLTKLNEKP